VKNDAKLIVWGVRGQQQFYPRITLIDETKIPRKDFLLAPVIYNQTEMHFPPQVLGQMDELLYFILASSYFNSGHQQETITSAERLFAKLSSRNRDGDENIPYIYLFVGCVFYLSDSAASNKSHRDKAVIAYRQGLEQTLGRDADLECLLRSNLGLALFADGKFVEAKEQLIKATELKTTQVVLAYLNLAFITEAGNERGIHPLDNTTAVAAIDKAFQLAPENPLVLYNKASLLAGQGRYEDAIKYLQSALVTNNTTREDVNAKYMNALIHTRIAGAYFEEDVSKYASEIVKEHETAIELLESLKQRQFQIPTVLGALSRSYSQLGFFYLALQDYFTAEKHLKKSLEYDPSNPVAHYNLGKVYLDEAQTAPMVFDRGRLDLAELETKRALDLYPNLIQANNNLGLVCYRKALLTESPTESLSLLNKSREYYYKEIKINPSYAVVDLNLSNTLFVMGSFSQGMQYLEKAKALDSTINMNEVLTAFAEWFSSKGRKTEADRMRKKSDKITSKSNPAAVR